MFNFPQTFQVLKNAVSMKKVPNYQIISENEISDDFELTRKAEENHEKSVKLNKKYELLIRRGFCEIDNSTSDELLRIFHELIRKKIETGNYYTINLEIFFFKKSKVLCSDNIFRTQTRDNNTFTKSSNS